MSTEFETAALASVGELTDSGKSDETGSVASVCQNCGEGVRRKFCGACGQLAQDFHRPIGSLIVEGLGDFLALDGRVARTIPSLLINPGRITRNYLDGKRQRYVPPFRLYLLSSFIFFLTFFSLGQSQGWLDLRFTPVVSAEDDALDVDEKTDVEPGTTPSPYDSDEDPVDPDLGSIEAERLLKDDGRVDRDYLDQKLDEIVEAPDQEMQFIKGLVRVGADIYDNPRTFTSALQSWAPRLALALTPAMIACLILVFPFRRGVYIYDHVITALHFQTWLYLMTTVVLLLFWMNISAGWWLFFLAPPVYIYRLMRRVYGSGRFFGLLRTFIILALLTIIFLIWIAVVFAFSASETMQLSR